MTHADSESPIILIVTGSPIYSLGLAAYINDKPESGISALAVGIDEIKNQLFKSEVLVLDEKLIPALRAQGIGTEHLPKTILLSAREHAGRDLGQLRTKLCAHFGARWTTQALEKQIDTATRCQQRRKTDSPACDACGLRHSWQAQPLPISAREMQVFERIAEGKRPASIAREMGISVKTVESHQSNIKLKLGIESTGDLRTAALRWRRGESISRA